MNGTTDLRMCGTVSCNSLTTSADDEVECFVKAGVAVYLQSINCLNSRVSLCFVSARLITFLLLYFKILTDFTCKRI